MSSHRQIFKSSAIIGSASAINVIIGLIKVKVLAVLLGPTGIGLMGLYDNIMRMGATLTGCGISNSGVRQLAASRNEESMLAIIRRALWLGNLILGMAGLLMLWFFREPVALLVFGDTAHATEVGWLGVGVLLSLVSASQTALLQGLRRIGDQARVTIISAVLGTIVGVSIIWLMGEEGVIWFVVSLPAISALIASIYARKLPRLVYQKDWARIRNQWIAMLKLGIPFMAAGLLTLATQLAVRTIIVHELGLEASGHFQAAWSISMTYIGFVLGAMGADYFPRLTSEINDHRRAGNLVNEQSEMALLLAGPVLLVMVTLAPWVITLLYSVEFVEAVDILRWQVMGDILKVASWPMGFILLALGRGGLFIGTEITWNAVYFSSIYFGIDDFGLLITGLGFFVSYIVYVIFVWLVAKRLIDYQPNIKNIAITSLMLLMGSTVIYVNTFSPSLSYIVGGLLSLSIGAYSLLRLNKLLGLREWLITKMGIYRG